MRYMHIARGRHTSGGKKTSIASDPSDAGATADANAPEIRLRLSAALGSNTYGHALRDGHAC